MKCLSAAFFCTQLLIHPVAMATKPHWVAVSVELFPRANKSAHSPNETVSAQVRENGEFDQAYFYQLCQTQSSRLIELLRARAGDLACDALTNLYSTVTSLDLAGQKLKSLEGIEAFHQLESIDFSSNEVNTLEAFRGLRQLQSINGSNKRVTDLRPLEKLSRLEVLKLSNNRIRNLAPLQNLRRLKTLNVSENFISDCNAVTNLNTLETLQIAMNTIHELPELPHKNNLRIADFSSNMIQSIPKSYAESHDGRSFEFQNNPLQKRQDNTRRNSALN
jgi:Leucine-rich repeat (LRR) protein